MRYTLLLISILFYIVPIRAQLGSIMGQISDEMGAPAGYATVNLVDNSQVTVTDEDGAFEIADIPLGTWLVEISFVGYETVQKEVTLTTSQAVAQLDITLKAKLLELETVVVTGTKTFQRQTESPIIVNVTNSATLEQVQACNLSEGLRFQPGLRVETDCQTCNYTQLRMNGLAGGYSQILINGRPIFSPLTGLYGLEQLPVNMIERIEVVRGGASSLYGSSAIGGTVNVITKIPRENNYALQYNYQNVNAQTHSHQVMGNGSLVAADGKLGLTVFGNSHQREWYDHNEDNFSELPQLNNLALGTNIFILPTENQKLELSFNHLYEYRYGGEMVDLSPHLTQQAEERTHRVWMANADYQYNFNNENSAIIAYGAWQHTDRTHYTGILPDDPEVLEQHVNSPPYGQSDVFTVNTGLQLNHRIDNFLLGENVITIGSEYIVDKVTDEIPAYRYLIDQTTQNFGAFVQSDWKIAPSLTLLSGLRMDQHNFLDRTIWSPRMSLLYKWKENTQFRLNYGAGFRAPQAFDADLHIAFAGGGVSRISLSPTLQEEISRSWSASVNYDRPMENFIGGFTLEAFHTRLDNAFILQPLGEDEFGETFEKRNGQGATVQGVTLELRANYDRQIQIESGLTLQSSEFDEAVQYIETVEGTRDFVRTPNLYGFATFWWKPTADLELDANYVYTGSMQVPHFGGAPNQDFDAMETVSDFHELSTKLTYHLWKDTNNKSKLSLFAGVKNIFNAYQSDFDIGKNRDSNYIYGPGLPRSFYVGVRWSG